MLRVRDIRLADCDAVASIHVRGWQAAYRGIMDQYFLDTLDVNQRAERWRSNLSSGNCPINLLVENGHGIVAFGGGGQNRTPDLIPETTGELWALYTDPDYWGQGSGGVLIEEFRRRLGTSYCVWVARENRVGRRFYEKQGGKILPAIKDETVGGAVVPHIAYLFE